MTWVTLARVIPSCRAISAWVATLPDSRRALPFDGLPEEFDYSGGLGFSGRFGVASAGRDSAYHPVRGRPAPQGADVAVFERPLGPEGDLDRLFAVGGHGGATVAILGEMDDPEPDLRLDPSRAGSYTVTFGEPALFQARGWGLTPPAGFFLSLSRDSPFPEPSITSLACVRCSWQDQAWCEMFTPVS